MKKDKDIIEIPISKIKDYIDIPEEELNLLDSVTLSIESINQKNNVQNTITIPVYDIKKELKKFSFDKDDVVTIPISEEDENELQETVTIPVEEIKKELEKAETNLQDTITISIDEIKKNLINYKTILNTNINEEDEIEEESVIEDTTEMEELDNQAKENREEFKFDLSSDEEIEEDTIVDINEKLIEPKENIILASQDEEIEKTISIPIDKIVKEIQIEKEKTETIIIPVDEIKVQLNKELETTLEKTIEIPKDLIVETVKNDIKKEKKKYLIINNKKVCKKIWIVLFIICVVGVISLLYNIFCWNNQSNNLKQDNQKVEKEKTPAKKPQTSIASDNEKFKNQENIEFLNKDIKEERKTNEEIIAWIKINNTDIDFPITQGKNNEYYQEHSSYNSTGDSSIYMDYQNDFKNIDKNTVLYADINKKSSKYSSFRNIINAQWYKNKQNQQIKISGKDAETVWQVFSIYTTDKQGYSKVTFESESEFTDFYNGIKINSFYNYNIDLENNDKILTIASYFDNDLKVVLHAKLIAYEEHETEKES